MTEDHRFTDVYNQRRRETETLHSALTEYLNSESATIKDIAAKYNITISRLAKHATIHIKAEHRRWAGKGRSPMAAPPEDIQQVLFDALQNGHPYATLVHGVTPQMSRYYRYRWRDWLIGEGHMKES